MAAVMPATPTTPMTTTVPLPEYQVSGAGAAVPRHVSGSGSVGAFFGVLAAVLVLTVLSCVFGRVCAAQAEGPDESYDCTRLVRRRWRAPRQRVPAEAAKQLAAPQLPLPEP
ncbi:uncharacterized protein LOC133930153 [Phragmites australis]|uniref:uncharacterized protein LOC133930153 n=1 Tax=Phragmites australis TaxID=29695 RepID=UPI002D78EA4F|nr:uncharacterized protein LOC133930153 [Phragmites australis]